MRPWRYRDQKGRDKIIIICSWYDCLFRKSKKFYRTNTVQQGGSYKAAFKNSIPTS